MTRIKTIRRRCPECMAGIAWVTPEEDRLVTSEVVCRSVACLWQGPWYDTVRVVKVKGIDPLDFEKRTLTTLNKVFDQLQQSSVAQDRFEHFLQNHARADVSQTGHATFKRDLERLSRLAILRDLVHIFGLGRYERTIVGNEISLTYPSHYESSNRKRERVK